MSNASNVAVGSVRRVCSAMRSADLFHVNQTLESELISATKAGVRCTQAHVGMLEMMQACADELLARGEWTAFVRPEPPRLVCTEDGIRYQVAVLVF